MDGLVVMRELGIHTITDLQYLTSDGINISCLKLVLRQKMLKLIQRDMNVPLPPSSSRIGEDRPFSHTLSGFDHRLQTGGQVSTEPSPPLSSAPRRCRNGNNCWFFLQGWCNFHHDIDTLRNRLLLFLALELLSSHMGALGNARHRNLSCTLICAHTRLSFPPQVWRFLCASC